MLKNPEYAREAISISPLWGSEIHPMEENLSKISKKEPLSQRMHLGAL